MNTERLHCFHVDLIDIGSFFAIHLMHTYRLFISARDRLMLKALALHHVAPVTRGVADADQDWFVQFPRRAERLVAPFEPVYGVVRVLKQIWK